MRYLAVFIAIITLSCRADDLDLRSDPAGGSVEPVPCLSLCKDACDAYGDWSDWSPATNTECEGKQFIQSSSRTRSCPLANNLCDGVTCPTEKKKQQKVYGTKKDCTDPPTEPDPQCKQCDGCESWKEEDWQTTSTEGECNSKSFNKHSITHNQKRTRKCSEDCIKDDCDTEGTRGITEECSYCEGTGQKLINKGKDNERCKCNEDRGFVKKGNECVCKEGYALNVKGDACEEERKEERTCADFCTKPWGNWGEWDIPENKRCPTTNSLDKPSLTAEIATRERTRVCENNTLGCFTTNVETHITPCTYCEGNDRKIINAGTDKEECKCKEEDRFYRDGDECVECESPSEISGGECIEQEEEQEIETESEEADEDETDTDTDTNTDTDIDIEPESEPEPEEEQQTEEQTCADFSCEATWSNWSKWTIEGNSCPVSSSFDKPDLTEEQKTRTRTRDCGNDPLGCFFTSNTETHITSCTYCEGNDRKIVNVETDDEACVCDCSQKFYKDNGACAECNTTTHKLVLQKNGSCQCVALPPEPEGEGEVDTNSDGEQELEIETPADECPPNKIRIEGKCVCDASNNYYRTGNTCTLCESRRKKFDKKTNTCVCDDTRGFGLNKATNTCVCSEGEEELCDEGICECAPRPGRTSEGLETDCNACEDWTTWGEFTDCDTHDSFDPPSSKQTRSRTRTCNNLRNDVQCFTKNTETQTCAWCQGEGQKLVDGECICDKNKRFYKDDKGNDDPADDECVSCGDRQVNDRGDGCVYLNRPQEITENGIKKHQTCEEKEDLRQVARGQWQCVTCGLEELLSDSGLHVKGLIGRKYIGKECYCATHSGDGSRRNTDDAVKAATYDGIDDNKHDVFVYWRDSLNTWYNETGLGAPALRIRNAIKRPPPASDNDYGYPPELNEGYWLSMLWDWYLDAHRATQSHAKGNISLYPPLPQVWKNLYEKVRNYRSVKNANSPAKSKLRDDSDLRYITCTVHTWITND